MFDPRSSIRGVLTWYFTFAVVSIVVFVGLAAVISAWPGARPIVFATLISAVVVLGYIAWTRYLR